MINARCRLCGKVVYADELRAHLSIHSASVVATMSEEDVNAFYACTGARKYVVILRVPDYMQDRIGEYYISTIESIGPEGARDTARHHVFQTYDVEDVNDFAEVAVIDSDLEVY